MSKKETGTVPNIPPESMPNPPPAFLVSQTTEKDYKSLSDVLKRAYEQASKGKGKERHAQDLPFDEQPMQLLCRLYGDGFALGQAAKKAQESRRFENTEQKVHELLGAINYIAGAIIYLENK